MCVDDLYQRVAEVQGRSTVPCRAVRGRDTGVTGYECVYVVSGPGPGLGLPED